MRERMRGIHEYRNVIVAICAAIVVWFFFLPWIKVHSTTVGAMKGIVGGEHSAAIITASGAGVPGIANGPLARTLIEILGKLFGSIENADKKSYLVWIVPALAVVFMALSLACRGWWFVSALLGLLCMAIAMGATCKLLMTNLDGLLFRVQICFSLWAILTVFGIMGVVHLTSIPVEIGNARRRALAGKGMPADAQGPEGRKQ